jgi:carboxyl-terminal processing protease
MTLHRPLLLTLLTILACDPDVTDERDLADDLAGAPESTPIRAAAPAKPDPRAAHGFADPPAMPDAQQAFDRALALITKHYVDPKIDRDTLYTGALEGMLARLYQVEGHPVNELLSPRALAELMHGTEGTLVGVGIVIEHVADVVVVRDVIPDGPAATGGLQRGDRILGIDGERLHGRTMVEIVDKIRGPAGSEVELFVQRDVEEWQLKLTRATIAIQNVESRLLDDGVGYLRLRGFAATTPAELDAAIAALQAGGMRSLIVDLRDCPGGLLDSAITVTGRFLARGQAIVTVVDRERGEKRHVAETDGPWRELPLVALIGPATASSAEILADALATHQRGTLIGEVTLGKGTVEGIHELGNGWALKLSTGRFLGASGQALQGRGVRPHLPARIGDEPPRPIDAIADDGDAALTVARSWLAQGRAAP